MMQFAIGVFVLGLGIIAFSVIMWFGITMNNIAEMKEIEKRIAERQSDRASVRRRR